MFRRGRIIWEVIVKAKIIVGRELKDFSVGQRFKNKEGVILDILEIEGGGVFKVRTIENGEESVGLWDWRRFSLIIAEYGFKQDSFKD